MKKLMLILIIIAGCNIPEREVRKPNCILISIDSSRNEDNHRDGSDMDLYWFKCGENLERRFFPIEVRGLYMQIGDTTK